MPLSLEADLCVLNCERATIAALALFKGVLLPNLFAKTFFMPANSKTVLIEPPAITPVPGAAGLISTLAAPSLPIDKVGIELFGVNGTLTRFFLPSETPFLTAPMTSPAFQLQLRLDLSHYQRRRLL